MKVLVPALIAAAFALPAHADEALAKKHVWGPVPAPNPAVPDADLKKLVEWILKQA